MKERLSRQPSRRSWPCWLTGASGRQRDRGEAELELGREAIADVVAQRRSAVTPAAGRTRVAVSPPKGWSRASSAGTAPSPAPRAVHSWRYRSVWTWSRSANIRPLACSHCTWRRAQSTWSSWRPSRIQYTARYEPRSTPPKQVGVGAEAQVLQRSGGDEPPSGEQPRARPCNRRRSGHARTSGCRRPRARDAAPRA